MPRPRTPAFLPVPSEFHRFWSLFGRLLLCVWLGGLSGVLCAAERIALPGYIAAVRARPYWVWRDQFSLELEGVVTWVSSDGKRLVLEDETGALLLVSPEGFGGAALGKRIRFSATNAHPFLASAPGFPHKPDQRAILRDFEIPVDSSTQFVDRLSGYIIAPRTGEYRFAVAADDTAELWLGTRSPHGERRIAATEMYTEPRDWNRVPAQKSAPIHLEAGVPYYIEAVHDQGLGNSHLSVAWEGPGIKLQLIEGEYLRPARKAGETEAEVVAGGERGILREVWQGAVMEGAWVMAGGGFLEAALGVEGVTVRLLGEGVQAAPRRVHAAQKMEASDSYRWSETEGNVVFAAVDQGLLLLDLEEQGQHMRVEIHAWQEGDLLRVRDRRVRVHGVAAPRMDATGDFILGALMVSSAALVEVVDLEPNAVPPQLSIVDVVTDRSVGVRGGSVRVLGTVIETPSPTELVLRDEGNFSAFASQDGVSWTPIGRSVEVPMAASIYAGLAINSKSDEAQATARFEGAKGFLENLVLVGVGQAAERGAYQQAQGEIRLEGRGREIWHGPDQFSYACTELKDEGELTVRITALQSKDCWSKAGLLMRSGLDVNASYVGLLYAEAGGACLQYRGGRLGLAPVSVSDMSFKPPYWMRLRRAHATLRVYLDSPYKVELGGRVSVTGYVNERAKERRLVHAVCAAVHAEEEGGRLQGIEPHSVVDMAQVVTGKASLRAGPYDIFRIRGVITLRQELSGRQFIAMQDSSAGAFLMPAEGVQVPYIWEGQRVEVHCRATPEGGSPVLFVDKIRVIGEGVEPQALRHPLENFWPRRGEGLWIETEGVVRSVSERGVMKLKANGETMSVALPLENAGQMAGMVDAVVRVRGVLSYTSEQERLILVPALRYVQLIESSGEAPAAMKAQAVGALRQAALNNPGLHRVKLRAQVTYIGDDFVQVEEASGAAKVMIADKTGLTLGSEHEWIGFPECGPDRLLVLSEVIARPTGAPVELEPLQLKAGERVAEGVNGSLVRFQAVVLQDKVREDGRSLELSLGSTLVQARHSGTGMRWAAFPEGSLVEVQGIWLGGNEAAEREGGRAGVGVQLTRLLLRNEGDLVLVQTPRLWLIKRTLLFSSMGASIVFVAAMWILVLRRRVAQRTAELQATMARLRQETQASATLAERNRLAGEIHDSLEQGFSALVFQLDTTMKMLSCPEQIKASLGLARSMVIFSRTELKHAVWDLESPVLENADLGTALELVAAQFSQETPRITVLVEGERRRLAQAMEHHVLRMAQEALANAVKHSGASLVEVRIKFSDTELTLEVRDEGRGFVPEQVFTGGPGHFGLRGLRSRARKIDGELTIVSQPGQGAKVRLRVPLGRAGDKPVQVL